MRTETLDSLLRVVDVAEYVGVNPMTVRRWIASGRLHALQPSPKVIRVRMSDLEAFLETNDAKTVTTYR